MKKHTLNRCVPALLCSLLVGCGGSSSSSGAGIQQQIDETQATIQRVKDEISDIELRPPVEPVRFPDLPDPSDFPDFPEIPELPELQ